MSKLVEIDLYCNNVLCPVRTEPQTTVGYSEPQTGAFVVEVIECSTCGSVLYDAPQKEAA